MIVAMKKATVVVQSKDAETTLKSLRQLGVLHVECQAVTDGDEVSRLKHKMTRIVESIAALADIKYQRSLEGQEEEISNDILVRLEEKEILEEQIKKRQKDIDSWREWGDFDPAIIDELRGKSLWVRLARIPSKALKQIPEDIVVETLFKKNGLLYCVLISKDEKKLPFDVLELPKIGLNNMLKLQDSDLRRIKEIEKKILDYAKYKKALSSYLERLGYVLQFQEVWTGMGKHESLSYLRGYLPYHSVSLLEKRAKREQWAILLEDPGREDNVPTLIKNPRWVEIIKPLFDIIKALPGYREPDISLWFLLFFSVFFGILIGDLGYGAVVFAINFFVHRKFEEKLDDKRIFSLMYVLSTCAMIWGLLTGTFFGQAWLPAWFKPLMPSLTESKNVQALCFLIGAMHLSIAHLWRGIIKFPHLKALSEVGWICLLWGGFFLARFLILGETFPNFAKWFFMAGAGLIVLFANPAKNPLISVGLGVRELLLNAVNSFTDVVSYIRLFAVGIATVAVADAFNQMAANMGGGFFGGLAMVLILIFGHALNIVLGAMSILVHGLRLNVLEFSSHLNMEWSGTPYQPFKEKER